MLGYQQAYCYNRRTNKERGIFAPKDKIDTKTAENENLISNERSWIVECSWLQQ